MSWRIIGTLAVLLFGALFAWQGGMVTTGEFHTLRDDVVRLTDSVAVLQQRVIDEREGVRAILNDPATQESEARRRYGVLRPGERLYLVVPGDEASPTP